MSKSRKMAVLVVLAMASLSAWAGQTTGGNPTRTKQNDSRDCGCGGASSKTNHKTQSVQHQAPGSSGSGSNSDGMPTYSFASMLASLSVKDTPINYTPPVGPSLDTTIYYNQRDVQRSATFDGFNLSREWTMNWLSYIQDDPRTPGHSVTRYVAGGGTNDYSGYDPSTGAFATQLDGAVLVLTSANPVVYTLLLPDGGKDVFAASNGKTTNPREVYLSKVVDAQGNAVTLNYDSQMRLTSVTDAIGQSLTFQYTDAKNPLLVTGITDPFGRQATLGYNGQGQLDSITDEIGMTSTFTYAPPATPPPVIGVAASATSADPPGGGTVPVIIDTDMATMTTPYGTTDFSQTKGSYSDPTEVSIQATDPLGYSDRTEYHIAAPGIPFSEPSAPSGMATANDYLEYRDSFYWNKDEYAAACSGRGVKLKCDYTKARMKHFLHEYPCCEFTSGYLESVKYPLESRIWYDYAGQPSAHYPGTSSKPSHIGRVLDDGATQLTTYTYNAWGNVTSKVDPDGRKTVYTYAPNGIDVTEVQQQDGGNLDTIASYTYNDQHEPLTYTDAAGKTTTYTYNARGQRTSATDALGNRTAYAYDANGYLTTVTGPLGHVQRSFTYDADGRLASVADSRGYTRRYKYDPLNRVTQIAYPDGTTRKFAWNKLDLASETDRQGRTTTYVYDADRNLVSITDPLGHVSRMTYYPSGKLHTLTDPNGNVTTWTRDIEGRVVAKTYADGKGDVFTYDDTSRLASKTDALGQVTTYTYDPDDLLTGIGYAHAVNPTAGVTYHYGAAYPHLRSMSDGLGTTTLAYVPVGSAGALKLQSVAGPFGVNDTVSYTYDADGRVTDRTTDQPDGFTYDALGRVVAETNPLGTFNQRYLGATSQMVRQQLVEQGGRDGFRLAIGYDGNLRDRQLQSLIYTSPTSPLLPTQETLFAHNAGHQLLSKLDFSGSPLFGNGLPIRLFTYGYDRDDRLTDVKFDALFPAGKYGYDAAGNLLNYNNGTTFNATANSLNQLSLVNGKAWQYDADGNLLNDGEHAYTWSAANRLVKVTDLATGDATTFAYDGLGRRLVIGEQAAGGAVRNTFYLWCGDTICGARNSANQVTADYYPQGEQHDAYPSGGAADQSDLYYVRDQIGSIVGVMGADGTLRGSTEYTAYGAVRQSAGVQADFGYAGMLHDYSTGLYLTKYREYSPTAGRWLNRDPLGFLGGPDVYAYVGGDPMDNYDPYGLMNWPPDIFSQSFVDGVAGFGDGITFGWTASVRRRFDVDAVNYCDGAYGVAQMAGQAYDVAMVGVAGADIAPYIAENIPDITPYLPDAQQLGRACFLACSLHVYNAPTQDWEPINDVVEQVESLDQAAQTSVDDVQAALGDR